MSTRIDSTTAVRAANDVYARRFGDELILLHFGRGEYYGLDSIGAEIWERLEGGANLGEIATALTIRFSVEYERALADVISLVEDLRVAALLTT